MNAATQPLAANDRRQTIRFEDAEHLSDKDRAFVQAAINRLTAATSEQKDETLRAVVRETAELIAFRDGRRIQTIIDEIC